MSGQPGMILAGGLSRRMGENKCLLPFGGGRLLDHVLQRLQHQCELVFVNSNTPLPGLAVELVADDIAGFAGPLAGVAAGIAHTRSRSIECTHLLTAAADTPFFPQDLAGQLAAAVTGPDEIVFASAEDGTWHPTFALWPTSLEHDLRDWLSNPDNRRVRSFIERHPHRSVPFPLLPASSGFIDPFFNINRPEDYVRALSLLDELA